MTKEEYIITGLGTFNAYAKALVQLLTRLIPNCILIQVVTDTGSSYVALCKLSDGYTVCRFSCSSSYSTFNIAFGIIDSEGSFVAQYNNGASYILGSSTSTTINITKLQVTDSFYRIRIKNGSYATAFTESVLKNGYSNEEIKVYGYSYTQIPIFFWNGEGVSKCNIQANAPPGVSDPTISLVELAPAFIYSSDKYLGLPTIGGKQPYIPSQTQPIEKSFFCGGKQFLMVDTSSNICIEVS